MRALLSGWTILGLLVFMGCGSGDEAEPVADGGLAGASLSQTAADGLQAAQQAMQQRNFEPAIGILTKVIADQPDSAIAHFKLANCYSVTGKSDEALTHFSAAVAAAPENVEYRGARGVYHAARGEHDAALSDFSAALEIDPTDFRLFNQRGLAHASKQNFDNALADFDQVLAMNPRFAEGYNNRGFAKMKQGDGDGALQDFTACLRLNPDSLSAYSNRAALFMAANKPLNTISDLNQAIARNKFNPQYYERRQTALRKLGKTAEANLDAQRIVWLKELADWNVEVAKDSQNGESYAKRAAHFASANERRAALADFAQAIAIAPEEPKYYNARGLFLLSLKAWDLAVRDFSVAIAKDQTNPQFYNNRGLAFFATEKWFEAINDFNVAIEQRPDFVEAYHNRGLANLKFDPEHPQAALADLQHVTELKPDFAAAYHTRGLVHAQQEQWEQAVSDYSQAIELEENNLKYHANRQQAYIKLGRDAEAQADGQKVQWLAGLAKLNNRVASAPDSAAGYIQRASHLAAGGHQDIALTNYNKAVELEPSKVGTLTARAAFWVEQGEHQKAIGDCTAALQIEPTAAEVHSILGDAHLALGDFDKAVQSFSQTKRLDSNVAQAFLQRAQQRREQGDAAGAEADLQHAYSIDPSLKP